MDGFAGVEGKIACNVETGIVVRDEGIKLVENVREKAASNSSLLLLPLLRPLSFQDG